MYADQVTQSMQNAIDETYRRRDVQRRYNEEHGIEAKGIYKTIKDITDHVRMAAEEKTGYDAGPDMPKDEALRLIKELESQMKSAAKALEFEKAAALRDQVVELRRRMVGSDEEELSQFAAVAGRPGPIRYGRSQAGGRNRRRKYK
jgi:excinuclease ABC subunit B